MALIEMNKQRVLQAYGMLYQRANNMAQGAVQIEAQVQQFRQQIIMQASGVKTGVIQVKDLICAISLPDACASAQADRENLIAQSGRLTDANLAKKGNELMQGIEDPASVAVRQDQQRVLSFRVSPQK